MPLKLDEHTGVLIKKAARLFERAANMNLDKIGVTYAQTIFLVRLWEQDGQTQMELTKSSGLRQPTVVRTLERMERDKLLRRVRNQNDKRCFNFFLTDKARKICKKLEEEANTMQSIAAGAMDDNKLRQINKCILEIIKNLQQYVEAHQC